ncbi:unnamed protein product [Linum tenue]|uniref:Protein kinase domain-containing protein n=1 Tax=Linum tenue TaxID=586396 RepID=A0AAV0MPE2_9ROSI|nr:unnamed protein product [Linum tenue]
MHYTTLDGGEHIRALVLWSIVVGHQPEPEPEQHILISPILLFVSRETPQKISLGSFIGFPICSCSACDHGDGARDRVSSHSSRSEAPKEGASRLGRPSYRKDKIHSKMGEGTFGQVLECWDRERKEMVAVKIVRGIKKYREAAMIEIDVLQQLGKHDRGGNRFVPILANVLLCLKIAVMHDLRLIHTDLKPENILLVSSDYGKVPDYRGSSRSPRESSHFKRVPNSSAIKVIDFGSTTYDRPDQTYIVSTRHYRAPEVILGLGWSYPCDVWSIGCILVELCTGEALFQTHENLEHLAMMERVLGPLPLHMLKRADRHADKYVRRGKLDWPEGAASRESVRAVMKLPRLPNLIMQHVDHSAGDLIHLLQGLLRYDPSERLTARAALRHSFFTREHPRR